MKRFLGVVAAVSTAVVLAGSPAVARGVVDVQRDGSTTWVTSSVTDGDFSKVEIKVFSRDGDKARLWQRCSFSYAGPGVYRCGIDSATGSLADARGGDWTAKVTVDGHRIARQSFTL